MDSNSEYRRLHIQANAYGTTFYLFLRIRFQRHSQDCMRDMSLPFPARIFPPGTRKGRRARPRLGARRGGLGAPRGPGREAENARRWSATSCSPTGLPRSTIGARGLNFRVRDGTGCASPAMVADQRRAFCCQGRALRAAQRDSRRNPPPRTASPGHGKRRARPISAARLRRSHALHLRPINLVVYQGPYRRENSSWDWLPA